MSIPHSHPQNSELKTKFSLFSATQLLFAVTTSFPALSQRVHWHPQLKKFGKAAEVQSDISIPHSHPQNSALKTKFSLLSATQLLFAVSTSFPALSQRVH
jgi:hypothetical protein